MPVSEQNPSQDFVLPTYRRITTTLENEYWQDLGAQNSAWGEEQDSGQQCSEPAHNVGAGMTPSCNNVEEVNEKTAQTASGAIKERDADPQTSSSEAASFGKGLKLRAPTANLLQDDIDFMAPRGVDLSALEGSYAISAQIEASRPNSHDSDERKTQWQSYFYPEDPDPVDWKPLSMRFPYLATFSVISSLLGVGQEVLLRRSIKQGGLVAFDNPQDLTVFQYFLWRYLPAIVMILFAISAQTTDYQVKRLDPFYHLAGQNGAIGTSVLLRDPVSYWTHLRRPFSASARVWVSSVMTILATITAPVLQNASLLVGQHPHSSQSYVYISRVWSRLLTSVFAVISVCALALTICLRTPSGLSSNPGGISGIIAMLTRSHILQDFSGLSPLSSDEELYNRIARRRYILYKSYLWQGEYRHDGFDKKVASPSESPKPYRLALGKEMMWPLFGMALLLQLLTPLLIFSSANVVLQRLPWILTVLGTLFKELWVQLDTFTRRTEPYWQLARGHAPSSTLTVDYTGTVIFVLPFKAWKNGHYHLAFLALNNVFAQVLIVCLASFGLQGSHFYHRSTAMITNDQPSDPETFVSFWVSYAFTVSTLCSMILAMTMVWIHRRSHWLPRNPGSIASIMTYIHSSKLTYLIGMEQLSARHHRVSLEMSGRRYGLGWCRGRDGSIALAIDEEPMMARYRPGFTYQEAIRECM